MQRMLLELDTTILRYSVLYEYVQLYITVVTVCSVFQPSTRDQHQANKLFDGLLMPPEQVPTLLKLPWDC